MRIKIVLLIILAHVIKLHYPIILKADIINVPGDSTTINSAIIGAEEGDTILVKEGIYYEIIDFRGKGILITSNYLLNSDSTSILQTIIDADSSITGGGSVVSFINSEDSTSILNGFTIRNGIGTYVDEGYGHVRGYFGGGIYGLNASPIITSNIIMNNVVDARPIEGVYGLGGGIYFEGGSPQIMNNLISNNGAYAVVDWFLFGLGGGIYLTDCLFASVKGNQIISNESGYTGSAILVNDCWVTISENDICNNKSTTTINCEHYLLFYPVFIYNNRVIGNEIMGIGISDGYYEVEGNLIAFNEKGSGIYVGRCDGTIKNNTIVANGTQDEGNTGGGITLNGILGDVINNNVVGNYAYGIKTSSGSLGNSLIDYNE